MNLALVPLPEVTSVDTPNGRFYSTADGLFKYPSVTTVLGRQAKDTGLQKWIDAVGVKEAERQKNFGGRRGSQLHAWLEDYVLTGTDPIPGKFSFGPDIVRHMIFRNMRRELDAHLTKVYGCEVGMISHILRLGGRCDLIGQWDGEDAIIDYKNSKNRKPNEDILSYFLQTTAYSLMFEEITGIACKKIVILIGNQNEDTAQCIVENRSKYLVPLKELLAAERIES